MRPILGIRRDSWGAAEFGPFEQGPEFEVEPVPLTSLQGPDALMLLKELLAEAGIDASLSPGLAEALAEWTRQALFAVCRRCYIATATGEPLHQAVAKALELLPRHGM